MNHDIKRLIAAAKAWAIFQEGDSLGEQPFDSKLQEAAIEARERLLTAIEAIGDRVPE